ncbi:MAG: hypothetical protein KGQ41_01910, partial [Alphaproteobacteria bacterium]|nr:hypothetical protein [Alphaproteobacteria bacterium]
MMAEKTLSEVWRGIAFERGHGDYMPFRIGAVGADGTKLVGTTGFFRQPQFQRRIMGHMANETKAGRDVSLFCVPSSVGCAPLSFAMMGELKGAFYNAGKASIVTTDIHQPFLNVLRDNLYPLDMLRPFPDSAIHMMEPQGKYAFKIRDDIHARVTALPAMDFRDYTPEKPFDLVDCCNLLQHLDGDLAENVAKILSFAASAAFFDRSKRVNEKAMDKAISKAGYIPVTAENAVNDPAVKDVLAKRRLNWVAHQS